MTPSNDHLKPRVLIVDDCTLSNRVMVVALRIHGFPCHAVTSEAAAMKAIDEFRPDVVVLEWASRTERRVDQAARLRSHARASGRRLAVIVVTQEYEHPTAIELAALDGYFTKPVALEKLEETIVSVIKPHAR